MGPRAPHAGGYNQLTADRLKNVALPDKICCVTCKKWKAVDQYSNKQLNDLRFKITQFGPPKVASNSIRCRVCTGTQVTELTCVHCGLVKPLTSFGKVHRGDPDNARCTMCIDEVSTVEPGAEDLGDPESDDDDDDETLDSNPFDRSDASTVDSEGGASLSQHGSDPTLGINRALGNMSIAQHRELMTATENWKAFAKGTGESSRARSTSGSAISESGSSGVHSQAGNVWVRQTSGIPAAAKQYTGYDSKGNPHSRYHVPSCVATAESSGSYLRPASGSRERFPKPDKTPVPRLKVKPINSKYDYSLPDSDNEDDDDADYALPISR